MENKFVEKLMSIIGVEDDMSEGNVATVEDLYEELDQKEVVEREYERQTPQVVGSVVSHTDLSMMLIKPKTHADAQIVIDSLKAKQPIIVNLEKNDVAEAQRVIDFVSGAVYALGGEVKVISKKIFAIVPDNIGFSDAL